MTRRRHVRSWMLGAAALLGFAIPSLAQPLATGLDRALAAEPVEVTTQAGRTVHGLLDGFRDGRLHVRRATDGGEVAYSYAPSELARVTWPGAEMEADAIELLDLGRIDEALALLQALSRHRLRYLPVLPEPRQRALWLFVHHGCARADPDDVRAVIRALDTIARDEPARHRLVEASLELAQRLHDADAMAGLARAWCARADPAGESAFGWAVLAGLAYSSGDYARARWVALQPVTFTGHLPMRDLDRCYAYAIAAASRAGDAAHAAALRHDMAARALPWPDDPALATFRVADAATSGWESSTSRLPELPETAAAPPPPTTFESLQKLTSAHP